MNKLIPAAMLLSLVGTAYAQAPSPEEMMKENDTNNDGIVTREEAAKTPLKDFFDMVDANHDSKVTLAELKAMFGG